MDKTDDFDKRVKAVQNLVTQRSLRQAHQVVLELTGDYDDRVEGWFQLALINLLIGRRESALRLIGTAARNCPNYTPIVEWDFWRDIMFDAVRRGRLDKSVTGQTATLAADIVLAKQIHADDPNRLACLDGLEARLLYARGDYVNACAQHGSANRSFTDSVWRANNMAHWLRALIMNRGGSQSEIPWILAELKSARDQSFFSAKLYHRVRLISRFGRLGCKIYDAAQWVQWHVLYR